MAIDAENTDNAAINVDNTSNAATDSKKSDDAAMSDNNTDNATSSTVDIPSPLHYGRKTKDPSKIKTSTKHTPTIVEPSIDDPLPNENIIAKASGNTFDPTDVHIYEFLIQGAPNPLDLESIEEDQLLEIQ